MPGPPTRGVIIYGNAVWEKLDKTMVSKAVPIFERYMPKDEAQVYAEGLSKISTWIGVTITPIKTASFDYGKDELYRRATKGQL